MSKAIWMPLLGRHWSVQITPQTISASGAWSNHSLGAVSFRGAVDQDSFDLNLNTLDATPLKSFLTNPVPKDYTATFTLTEIPEAKTLWNGTAGSSKLEACLRASWYHKIQIAAQEWTYSGSGYGTSTYSIVGSGKYMCWTMYAVCTGVKRESPKGKTVYVGTFQLVPVGDGVGGFLDNPDYTAF